MARIINSLDEYAIIVQHIGTQIDRAAIDSMRKTRARVDQRLTAARHELAGGGHLSRVGRATGYGTRKGAFLSHTMESPTLANTLIVRAKGPWQLVDDSISGGPTAGHDIGPRHDRNPRPLTPAKRVSPSLEFRPGGEFSKSPVYHPGSVRRPVWRRFVRSIQPTIADLFGDDWRKAIAKAVG